MGGIAGWLASILTGRNDQQGCLMNIIAGIIGATVGGWIVSLFGIGGATGFNIWSLIVAVIGAVVVLAILNLLTRRRQ
jgi:uncharacterized membrane protein YeaQ/YmgE (transglycosylase-associated protein family)